jgi:hypothetical protein
LLSDERIKSYGALDAGKRAAFTRDLLAPMERDNRLGDGTLVLPSEYLEEFHGSGRPNTSLQATLLRCAPQRA